MQTVIGGVTADLSVAWPATVSGWLLLLCYVIFFGLLITLDWQRLTRLSWKQWLLLLLLGAAAFVLSVLQPPIPLPDALADRLPASLSDGQTVSVAFLAAVPYLLAGVLLGPAPALLAGFAGGLGTAWLLSGKPSDPFIFAFAAWIAARMMSLWYQGRGYQVLRSPLVSGSVGQVSMAFFTALVALANSSDLIPAIDAALAAFQAAFWPALITGLVSGALVTLLVRGMAQWRPRPRLQPSPAQRSIRRYLQTQVVLFGAAVLLLAAAFIFFLSTILASRMLVTEMAAGSNAAAVDLEAFRADLGNVLNRSGQDEDFARGDKASAARGLGRVYRDGEHFDQVMLVSPDQAVVSAYPPDETASDLAESEQNAVLRAVEDGLQTEVVSELPGRGRMLSVVVPVAERVGEPPQALIGRVREAQLGELMAPALSEASTGLIIDRARQVLTATGPQASDATWTDPQAAGGQSLFVPAYLGGEAFLVENERQSRDIQYVSPPNGGAWRVVATTPYENVLNQAFAHALPLVLVLLATTGVFYWRFVAYGQNLAGPIAEMARASQRIAAGGSLTTPVAVDRQDEVGELGRAFTGMQRALKGRLDELSLLLEVSQDISTSIDISQSMPVILQGAVRGTGALGARAVILNPRGRAPLAFAQGPAGKEMKLFDRTLMVTLRDKQDLVLDSPQRMGALFGLNWEEMPVKALFAIPLQLNNKFQGVFTLGYRQAREFDSSERNLLHTLAGQAAVLVENAHLYARAESGRQRLQAVLASTTEAVLVTDQTDRVFMLNKAMEDAFQLPARQTVGRAVQDVISAAALVEALTTAEPRQRNLEVAGRDGRAYMANISPIFSRGRRLMGRVAVLHDVTQFKEADNLKSEFVANVSHDLKTPLTIISQSAAELGMDGDLSQEQKSLTDNILAAVDRIVNFVDTMLDIERLEAGKELIYETFDVGELLEELALDQWYFAHSSKLTIRTKVAENLPPLRADRAALYQAIENLLSNAIKYAPNSGELLLAAEKRDEQVVISLRDHGPGIAERDQRQVFDKGFRVKRHGAGQVKGSGMGLAYVRTAAERHGGRAWCESTVGKGSTFFVAVPAAPEKR